MAQNCLRDLFPWSHKNLIWQFARKDIVLRYRGSLLGGTWSVLSPLIMLAIYTFVFQFVLHARWPQGALEGGGTIDYALNLYAGLLIFNWFSECLGRAPRLILEQPYLVNKVIFPLHVLGWAAAISAGVQMSISLGIWLFASLLVGYPPTFYMLLLPLLPILLLPWLLALVWALSSVGVFLRDLSQLLPILITGLMFLSPVLYPVKALPVSLQTLAYLNPLSATIEGLRSLAFNPAELNVQGVAFSFIVGVVFAALALKLFYRLSPHFSDVL
jgi:lipopolysaccharide transport system permease protein